MSLIALAGWVHLPTGRERQPYGAERTVILGGSCHTQTAGQGTDLGAQGAGCRLLAPEERRSWQMQEMPGCPPRWGGCVGLDWLLLEQATRTGLVTLTA